MTTASDAMAEARSAREGLASHEKECSVRYEAINSTMTEIKALIKWGGTVALGIIVSLLAWSMNQQYQTYQVSQASAQARINALEGRLSSQISDKENPPPVR